MKVLGDTLYPRSLVSTTTEWGRLEEVIVGRLGKGVLPSDGTDIRAIEFGSVPLKAQIPSGPYPRSIISQTDDELDCLADTLEHLQIHVERPADRDGRVEFSSPDWKSSGNYDYCPRDGFLSYGSMILESPMVLRSRHFESDAYRALFGKYQDGGAIWLSAPKPRLLDDMYDTDQVQGKRLRENEVAFDAANILKLGSKLLYLVSDSGNERGLTWLRRLVAPIPVFAGRNLYASTHVDSTLAPLREGLVLANPARINEGNLPSVFREWKVIYAPEPVDIGFAGDYPRASVWIAMNILMLSPEAAIVDARQLPLMRLLESVGVTPIPLTLTHARTLGGGFHCVTLDIRRDDR